jgi:hypothetical protein
LLVTPLSLSQAQWRRKNFDEETIADIAERALRASPAHRRVTPEQVIDHVLSDAEMQPRWRRPPAASGSRRSPCSAPRGSSSTCCSGSMAPPDPFARVLGRVPGVRRFERAWHLRLRARPGDANREHLLTLRESFRRFPMFQNLFID